MNSKIDGQTLQAYRRAEYRMQAGWSIWIDRISPDLAAWHKTHGVSCSGFVSAVNPRSEVIVEAENSRRHLALSAWLDGQDRAFLSGAGLDPDGRWPAEPGFLIAGLGSEEAARLGRRFDQNAVVWSGADARPRLILLR